jgi:hypothetical protein
LKQLCSKGHQQTWQCDQGASAPGSCHRCEQERKEAEKKARKAAQDQQNRELKTQRHLKEVAKIQEEIQRTTQEMADKRLDDQHEAILAQMRKDLAAAIARVDATSNKPSIPQSPVTKSESKRDSPQPAPSKTSDKKVSSSLSSDAGSDRRKQKDVSQDNLGECTKHNDSASKIEWQRQKDQENANNPAIDKIMEMIGLEDVKSQVLRIKAKVETSIRQGTDLKNERLGLVLLGNPGTGQLFCY